MGIFGNSLFMGADILHGFQQQQAESHKRRVDESVKKRQELGQQYQFFLADPTTPPDVHDRLMNSYAQLAALPYDKQIPKELADPSRHFAEAMKARVMPKPPDLQAPAFATSEGTNTVGGGARWGLGDEGAPPEEFNLGSMGGMRENPGPIYTQRADKLTNPMGAPIQQRSMQDYVQNTLEPAGAAYRNDMAGYTPEGRFTPERAAMEEGKLKGIAASASLGSQMQTVVDMLRQKFPNMSETDLQRVAMDMIPNVNMGMGGGQGGAYRYTTGMIQTQNPDGTYAMKSVRFDRTLGQWQDANTGEPIADKIIANGNPKLYTEGISGMTHIIGPNGEDMGVNGLYHNPKLVTRWGDVNGVPTLVQVDTSTGQVVGLAPPRPLYDANGIPSFGGQPGTTPSAPDAPPVGVTDHLRAASDIRKEASDLIGFIKPELMGPLRGRMINISQEELGGMGLTPQQMELATRLKRLIMSEAFRNGGKQLTNTEYRLSADILPQPTDTYEQAIVKLYELDRRLKQQSMINFLSLTRSQQAGYRQAFQYMFPDVDLSKYPGIGYGTPKSDPQSSRTGVDKAGRFLKE